MTDEEIKNLIKEHSSENGINCATIFSISNQHDVPLKKIGDLCNEVKIKIRNCQLGCFK